MTPKELKKLAAACRAAGIRHYKDAAIEFTLADDLPLPTKRRSGHQEAVMPSNEVLDVASDTLSEDALLFWSSNEEGMQ